MSRFSPPQGSNGSTGTATAADVLTGFTFSNSQQTGQSGSMPNNGAVTLTPSGTGTVAVPAGYHNGAGVVAQVSIPAANVLSGTTIAGVAGVMPNKGAPTWSPGTANQSLAAGYYSGGTVNGDGNLIASNIKSGVSIFGVIGNAAAGAWGQATSANGSLTVSGLGFTPSTISLFCYNNGAGGSQYAYNNRFSSATVYLPSGSGFSGQSATLSTSSGSFTVSSSYILSGGTVYWVAT